MRVERPNFADGNERQIYFVAFPGWLFCCNRLSHGIMGLSEDILRRNYSGVDKYLMIVRHQTCNPVRICHLRHTTFTTLNI